MNKAELVARISIDTGLSKRQSTYALDAVLGAIQSDVARGNRVSLPGFGTFEPRKRAPRTARNPQTGATVKVPATTIPAFRPGQAFKAAVAGKRKRPGRSGQRRLAQRR